MMVTKRNVLFLLLVLIIFGYLFYNEINKGSNLRVNRVEAEVLLSKEADHFKVYYEANNKHPESFINIPAIRKTNRREWDITIEATGEKNSKSKSDEVWLFNICTPDDTIKWGNVSFPGVPWKYITALNGAQGTALVAYKNNPKSLTAKIYGGTLILTFRNHSWDGMVHVKAQDLDTLIDLYSPQLTWEHKYYFQPKVIKEDTIITYKFSIPVASNKVLSFVPPENSDLVLEEVMVNNSKASILGKNQVSIERNKLSSFIFCLLMTLIFAILTVLLIIAAFKQKTLLYIIFISLLLSFILTLIFFPGILTSDSVNQWNQALLNEYSTHHPPIIAMIMHLTIQFTSSPFIFTFIQSFLLLFSILYLIYQIVPVHRKILIASLLVVINPVFMIYTVIIWKDVWLVIFILFALSFFLKSIKNKNVFPVGVLFLCLAIASRHNAVILILLIPVMLFWIYGKKIKTIMLTLIYVIICLLLPKLPNTFSNVTIVDFTGVPWFSQYMNQIELLSRTDGIEYLKEQEIFDDAFGSGTFEKSLSLFKDNPSLILETIFFPKGLSEPPIVTVEKMGENANFLKKRTLVLAYKYPLHYIRFRLSNIKNLIFAQPSLNITDNLTDNYYLDSMSLMPGLKRLLKTIYIRITPAMILFQHIFGIAVLCFVLLIAYLKRESKLILLSICGLVYFAPFVVIDSFADWRYLFLIHCISYVLIISSILNINSKNSAIRL